MTAAKPTVALLVSQYRARSLSRAWTDVDGARALLGEAIALHQAHMDGTEPTTEASQMRMMAMMQGVLVLLGGPIP